MTEKFILYRVFDTEGVLLYVGATMDPGSRLRTHHLHQPWWDEGATITLEHRDTWEDLMAAETNAIETEGAKYNVIHSPHAVRSTKPRGPMGEGSIYQRVDGMWIGAVTVDIAGGKRKRRTVSSKNREVAEQRLAELLVRLREDEKAQ